MKLFLLFCFLVSLQVHATIYLVSSNELNAREHPDFKSNTLFKLKKGDTVTSLDSNLWMKINFKSKTGYVNRNFLAKIKAIEKKGFTEGFFEGMGKSFFAVFLVLLVAYGFRNKRIKDARFKEGYKYLPYTYAELLKFAIYALIISITIGLITGLFYLV